MVGSFGRAQRALIAVLGSAAAAPRTVRLPTVIRINRTVHQRSLDGGHFALRGNGGGSNKINNKNKTNAKRGGNVRPVKLFERLTCDRFRQQLKSTSREPNQERRSIVGSLLTLRLPTLFWFVSVLVAAFRGCSASLNSPFFFSMYTY